MSVQDFQPEIVAIVGLKPHPRNYKTHPDDQLEHIAQSIREHGIYRNIVTARDLTILAGHGVAQAAREKLGMETVPIRRLNLDPDDPKALKLLAADNEISHLGVVDDRALSELLKEVKETDLDGLFGTGYDDMMLANLVMVTRPASEIRDFDEAAHWVGMPEYEAGTRGQNPKIILNFRNDADQKAFTEQYGIQIMYRQGLTWTGWWPPKDRDDSASIKFEASHE